MLQNYRISLFCVLCCHVFSGALKIPDHPAPNKCFNLFFISGRFYKNGVFRRQQRRIIFLILISPFSFLFFFWVRLNQKELRKLCPVFFLCKPLQRGQCLQLPPLVMPGTTQQSSQKTSFDNYKEWNHQVCRETSWCLHYYRHKVPDLDHMCPSRFISSCLWSVRGQQECPNTSVPSSSLSSLPFLSCPPATPCPAMVNIRQYE